MKLPGETTPPVSEFDAGMVVGLLAANGSFGGDGRQPQVALKMHTDHRPLLDWLLKTLPGSKLYGPYSYDGRSFYQWSMRGNALKTTLVPLLDQRLTEAVCTKSHGRYVAMKARYNL